MRIIGGTLKNQSIIVPKGDFVRPTSSMVREALFNICQNYIAEARFLDLFAGSGSMGIEALSRGAAHATFVDKEREAIRCVSQNLEHLKLKEKGSAICGDVSDVLKKLMKLQKKFDLIYIDPPYGKELPNNAQQITLSLHLVQLIDRSDLLADDGHLFIEDIKNALGQEYVPESLTLVDQRKMGRTNLFQYRKKS